MLKLTARQEQILNLIKEAIENTGFPPTRAEIAAELGFRSANAAEEHLQALARKGAIEIAPGTSRGIRLVGASVEQIPMPPPSMMMLPLVGRVAAGNPILAQEHVEATYNVDTAMFAARPDFLLKVKGWSMRDAGIMDGDFLAVKKIDSTKNGQIVVARLERVRLNIAEEAKVNSKLIMADFAAWRSATETYIDQHNATVKKAKSERSFEDRR